jgi:uncharacterized membrane-anchored protein
MTTTITHGETTRDQSAGARRMLNKVPEVTLYFWLIKILCTTVGETAADFLNENLGLGLTNTTFIRTLTLVIARRLGGPLASRASSCGWLNRS